AGARGLQEMVAAGLAQTRGRRFSDRRGKVSQEIAFRARLRFIDGRSDEACADRARPNPKSDLRDSASSLRKMFSEGRSEDIDGQKESYGRGSKQIGGATS